MRLLPLVLISTLGLLGLWSCRTHLLVDQTYAFTLKEVIRDDCGLATTPGVFTSGTLFTTGNQVRMTYGYLNLELVGIYLVGEDKMSLDGSTGNVMTAVRGQECLLDTVLLHLETTNHTADSFEGEMSFTLDARLRPEACVCKLWVRYEAKAK